MEILYLIVILLYLFCTAGYISFLVLQKNTFYKIGFFFLASGFIVHSIAIVYASIKTGHFPVGNLSETLAFAGWTFAGVFLVVQNRFRLKVLGSYAAPVVTLIMIVSFFMPNEPSQAKSFFKSVWLVLHVMVIFMGEASFALACGVGIMYLFQENAIKTKNPGFFFKRLPSLELLDTAGYACIITGFTLLTVGLITGFLYAKTVWGKFWSWDPKEVWSSITWLFYAALIHERLAVGWRGRKAAVMSIVGFAVVLFTFFGVNFFLKGHHWEFTRW